MVTVARHGPKVVNSSFRNPLAIPRVAQFRFLWSKGSDFVEDLIQQPKVFIQRLAIASDQTDQHVKVLALLPVLQEGPDDLLLLLRKYVASQSSENDS